MRSAGKTGDFTQKVCVQVRRKELRISLKTEQAGQKIPSLFENQMFITMFTTACYGTLS